MGHPRPAEGSRPWSRGLSLERPLSVPRHLANSFSSKGLTATVSGGPHRQTGPRLRDHSPWPSRLLAKFTCGPGMAPQPRLPEDETGAPQLLLLLLLRPSGTNDPRGRSSCFRCQSGCLGGPGPGKGSGGRDQGSPHPNGRAGQGNGAGILTKLPLPSQPAHT